MTIKTISRAALVLALGVCSSLMAEKVTMTHGKAKGSFDGYVSYHKGSTIVTRFYKTGKDAKGHEIIVHAHDEYKLVIDDHVAIVPKREAKRIFLELEAEYDDQETIALSKHHAYRAAYHAKQKQDGEMSAGYKPLPSFEIEGNKPVQRTFFQIIRDVCTDCTGCSTGKQ